MCRVRNTDRLYFFCLFLILFMVSVSIPPSVLWAADFTAGELKSYSTIHSIGIEWDIAGDLDHDAVCTVRYRVQGGGIWKEALPLFRIDYNGYNMMAGSILFLAPGTNYEVELGLHDPDGGAESRLIKVATRPIPRLPVGGRTFHVVPGSGGGGGSQANPFKGVGAAEAAARPGDIFLLHAGNYGGRISFKAPGAKGNYIVWKAAGDGDVIFNGIEISRGYIWLEGIKNVSSGNGLTTANAPEDVVILGNTFYNCHYCIHLNGGGKDWYIADNVIVGDVVPEGGSMGGEGIELKHSKGSVVAYNSISRVADGISYASTNCDIFGNDIFDIADDGIEPDYGLANVRIWGNRINSVRNGISFQPMNSAPWYIIRNQIFAGYNAFKLRMPTDRALVAHNTLVGWGRVQTGCCTVALLDMQINNNLWISVTRDYIWENGPGGTASQGTNVDYDGFDDHSRAFRWGRTSNNLYNLKQFKGLTGLEQNAISIDRATCLETFDMPDPLHVPPQYNTLKAGCNAIDAGVLLPNINDDFSGSAPDLGAYEYGAPLPHYGPRFNIEMPPHSLIPLPPTSLSVVR